MSSRPALITRDASTASIMSQESLAPPELQRMESSGLAGTPHVGEPGPTDVICARGKRALEHEGNKRFRSLVASNLDTYSKAKSKLEKSLIVSHIVDQVRKVTPPGGFLRPEGKSAWVEVGDGVAREKIGQAFRDALHTQYRSSTKAKRKRRQLHGSTCSSSSSIVSSSKASFTSSKASFTSSKASFTSSKASFSSVAPQQQDSFLHQKMSSEPIISAVDTTPLQTDNNNRTSLTSVAAMAVAAPQPVVSEPILMPPTKLRRLNNAASSSSCMEPAMRQPQEAAPVVDQVPQFHDVSLPTCTEDQDSQDVLRLKRDSLFQKRDSLFQPQQHRRASRNHSALSVLSFASSNAGSEILKNIAALKTMLSPSDLDLDHDNENDHGNNITMEPLEHFQQPKRPSLLAQQRDSLRASLTQRRSFGFCRRSSNSNRSAASAPPQPRLVCMDQMPAFCKPDQILLHNGAVTHDFIQELNLQ